MPPFRILSISGGGAKGIIPATIIAYLEKSLRDKTNNPNARLADYFELVTATSVGTIIASILLAPVSETRKLTTQNVCYDADDLLKFFQMDAAKIFSESFMYWIYSLAGFKGPRYSPLPLAKLLNDYTANTLISQLRRNVIFASWNADGYPMMFTNLTAIPDRIGTVKENMPILKTCVPGLIPPNGSIDILPTLLNPPPPSTSPPSSLNKKKLTLDTIIDDFYLKDVVAACVSAPTYFPPTTITSVQQKQSYTILDGGTVMNNPTMYGISEMIKRGTPLGSMVVVSLGCGYSSLAVQGCEKFNELDWIKPVINIAIDGNDELTNDIVASIISPANYFRINPPIVTASGAMDDASPKNLKLLQDDATNWILENSKMLDAIIDKLTA